MKVTAVKSSVIRSVSHDAEKSRLTVNFVNGRSHLYVNVPESVVTDMVKADSAGKYFNQFVKNRYRQVRLDA